MVGKNPLEEKEMSTKRYEKPVQVLNKYLSSYGMTPAEAVDYVAVEKAGVPNGEWAEIRNVDHSTVSGNITKARDKISQSRSTTGEAVNKGEIVVTVIDSTGDEVPFTKDSSIIYQEEENALTHVHVDIDGRVRRERGGEE